MRNANANSEFTIAGELSVGIPEEILVPSDLDSSSANSPKAILESALSALSDDRISDVVAQFDERFTFIDHALALEFTDKPRLTQFFEKARELFPDTRLELLSLMESGSHAIAEWKLTATQTVPYGSMTYPLSVSVRGSTIARVENGRILEWSDYYDQGSSRRIGLASHFTDWIDC